MQRLLRNACLVLPLLAVPALAQWPSDPATNLVVADAPSDQILPKIAPTVDGGCYVSWFDGLANGFDVRLQRLDALGNEVWAHGGILVADRGFSSVQDYGLDVDLGGNALLAFRDDRFTGVQVTAQRVSSAGSLLWGANGVQLTSTTEFVANPKIAGTSDGEIVVAWMQDGRTRVTRLFADGTPAWPMPIELVAPSGQYTPADLHDHKADVVLSIVHQTGSISSPKHLLAQKLDADGAFLWGASPLAVFDGGSLQIGYFPSFVPDGSGGAVFAWYGVSPLQCYAQRIFPEGTEAFPHNGSVASNDASNVRVSPSVTFLGEQVFLFWKEQNAAQSQSGLSGQRFDGVGNALWGATGKTLVPVGSVQVDQVRALTNGTDAYVAWITSAGFGLDTGSCALVDEDGEFVVSPFAFASTVSGKSRLFAARSAASEALLAWSDTRDDGGDVLAQNVRHGGELGSRVPHTTYCFGVSCPCGNDAALSGCVNSTGAGATLIGLGNADFAADSFVLVGLNAIPGQFGLIFQGTELLNGGAGFAFADGLRCASTHVIRLNIVLPDGAGCVSTNGACGAAVFNAGPISTNPRQTGPGALGPGDTRYYQLWYRDPFNGPCGSQLNLTNGVAVDWN